MDEVPRIKREIRKSVRASCRCTSPPSSLCFEYVCEFLCPDGNEVGYMEKVCVSWRERKDTSPGWLGSAASEDYLIKTFFTSPLRYCIRLSPL